VLKDELIAYAKQIIKRATYTIGGKTYDATIGQVVSASNGFTVYIYADDDKTGTITNASLYDVNNKLLISRAYNTKKDTLATTTIGIKLTFSVTETNA
jgi:5S rRNA maturation endonuclease (ribonuclease M5)